MAKWTGERGAEGDREMRTPRSVGEELKQMVPKFPKEVNERSLALLEKKTKELKKRLKEVRREMERKLGKETVSAANQHLILARALAEGQIERGKACLKSGAREKDNTDQKIEKEIKKFVRRAKKIKINPYFKEERKTGTKLR